jgi:hypothetical protein
VTPGFTGKGEIGSQSEGGPSDLVLSGGSYWSTHCLARRRSPRHRVKADHALSYGTELSEERLSRPVLAGAGDDSQARSKLVQLADPSSTAGSPDTQCACDEIQRPGGLCGSAEGRLRGVVS